MINIFISHARADAAVAERLARDLKNAGHETKIDTQQLRLGDNTIEFMNQGIAQADVILILHSQHTQKTIWQRNEADAALWNEIAQKGGKCIIIRLDDTPIPPLLGLKVYGKLDPSDPQEYQQILETLCKAILPEATVSSIISEAFRAESKNPFRRVRAEYFEDQPDLLARTFAPHDALKMGALEDVRPCFLEGSRGTGKSMLLLSLRARNFLSRTKNSSHHYRLFGFYLKLSRGAVCNAGIVTDPNSDPKALVERDAVQITDIGAQELIICLAESLISEITCCLRQKLLVCDHMSEKLLVENLHSALFGNTNERTTVIEDLLDKLADAHRDISAFIRRKFIYGENSLVPVTTFDLETFKRIIKLVRFSIPILKDTMFVVLLDEYENLFPYQQRVVNGFIKLAAPEFSVKVAKKLGSTDVSGTSTGQELQETHDYTRLTLVYDVEDASQLAAYKDLLTHMIKNIMRSEDLKEIEPAELLPQAAHPEMPFEQVLEEVAKLCKTSPSNMRNWSDEKMKEKITYYGEAAIYRLLYGKKGRRVEKRFAGFSDLAFVSSGVIRYFQEILSVAYHLSYNTNSSSSRIISLPPDKQSKAVHFVSEHNLTTLSRNVEKQGEALKYFLLDIGDCLRYKLLQHNSEPEAARVTIEDPELLDQPELEPLRKILNVGVREGAFQTKEGRPAFKPKHRSDPQPAELNICRIYAPVLQISPRLRWRTRVKCKLLLGLVIPERRSEALQQLKSEIMMYDGSKEGQRELF
ncbi:MAG: hypothetical protein DMG65_03290 [Candidatus Angelobacter sp. Gp1-AA117]|nr:MAG: hypothetical protein DMG65_03290 [Candidatus Angelobacter sp. Gp1-AA117]